MTTEKTRLLRLSDDDLSYLLKKVRASENPTLVDLLLDCQDGDSTPDISIPTPKESFFLVELTNTLNKCGIESGSNTSDVVLAEFLRDCLKAFDSAIQKRNSDSSEIKSHSVELNQNSVNLLDRMLENKKVTPTPTPTQSTCFYCGAKYSGNTETCGKEECVKRHTAKTAPLIPTIKPLIQSLKGSVVKKGMKQGSVWIITKKENDVEISALVIWTDMSTSEEQIKDLEVVS